MAVPTRPTARARCAGETAARSHLGVASGPVTWSTRTRAPADPLWPPPHRADLTIADAYATALYAAGPAGMAWFRDGSDYRALFAHRR